MIQKYSIGEIVWMLILDECFRFEENHGFISGARKVYERAVEFFGDDYMDEDLYVAFAKFEERQKEVGGLGSWNAYV